MRPLSSSDIRSDPAVTAFVETARRFCELVDTRSTLTRRELVSRAHGALTQLYSQGANLPEIEPRETAAAMSTLTREEWWALFSALRDQLRDYDSFWVAPPGTDAPIDPGPSSLADDLADIYRDLKSGLALWDAKADRAVDAVWGWRFGWSTHWGRHAVDALGRVHTIIYEHDDDASSHEA